MNIYQSLNINNKNFKQNVNQNLNNQIEEPTTNSNTIIPNSTKELDNKDFDANSFNNNISLLNKKRERNESDNDCNDDIINDNIPNINTNNNKECQKNKKVIFITYKIPEKVAKKKVARKFCYDNAKDCIYISCMENIESLQKEIFQFLGLEKFKINATSKDKLGTSLDENIIFCQTKIKKIFCNSTQKNTKNKIEKKAETEFILKYILEQEEKDPNIKIKLLNSIFNLPYKYFLYAYLEDYAYIIISNDKKGKKIVTFLSDINSCKDSLKNCLIFQFKTYKDCLNDKYNENQKIRYKKRMLKKIFGINLKK